MGSGGYATLEELNAEIVSCVKCGRLVRYREAVARRPPRRYEGWSYWARPLPGFGDPLAEILVVGLAPAAHGGNRTGRMFTGDGSGNTLMRALHSAGLASQPTSEHRDDGLRLINCYVTAALRCAPPMNKPTRGELERCFPYLLWEFRLLRRVKVIVALGSIAFRTCLRGLSEEGYALRGAGRPVFTHNAAYRFINQGRGDSKWLISSYHPSRQNTQTGRLTQAMLNRVFRRVARLCRPPEPAHRHHGYTSQRD